MSKDNVLKEGTVRRFMTLAGTSVLASDFLTEEASIVKEQEEEMEVGEEGGEEFADVEMDEPAMDDPDMEEPAMDDPDMEEPEEEGNIEDAVRAMVDAIAGVASDFGVDVEVGEEEPTELEVGEMPGEEEMGPEEGEMTGELGPPEEGGEGGGEEELALQEIDYIDEDHILNEVFRRVKSRLAKEKRVDNMASQLAEKISRRLNK